MRHKVGKGHNAETQRRRSAEAVKVSAWKETEIGLLPAEWEVKPISEVSEVVLGKTPPTKENRYWEDGTIPFITPGDMQMYGGAISRTERAITEAGLEAARPLPAGTVVVTCIGNIGKVGIVDASVATTNQQSNAIIPDKDQADNWYIAYAMMHLTPLLESRARMTTVPILNKTNFQKIPLPLPPLAEQRRIADALRTIQEAIAAQEDVIAAARELKRSLMKRVFTYGPGAEPAPTRETEVGEVPEHWEVLPLDEVLESTQYGTSERAELSGGYPVLRMNNLEDGQIDNSDLKYMDLDDEDLEKYRLEQGDVVFNRTNSFELVGKTALFDLEGDYVFASYLIRVVPEVTRLMPEYLNYYLNWPRTQRYLRQVATRGASQSNISATKLGRLRIALPDLHEQRRSVGVLQDVDAKIAAEEQRKAALEEFFRSALEQLMTGQIRLSDVHQDLSVQVLMSPDQAC